MARKYRKYYILEQLIKKCLVACAFKSLRSLDMAYMLQNFMLLLHELAVLSFIDPYRESYPTFQVMFDIFYFCLQNVTKMKDCRWIKCPLYTFIKTEITNFIVFSNNEANNFFYFNFWIPFPKLRVQSLLILDGFLWQI